MNTASETSSVMMTSLDMGLLELYVDEGFSFANRNRACAMEDENIKMRQARAGTPSYACSPNFCAQ